MSRPERTTAWPDPITDFSPHGDVLVLSWRLDPVAAADAAPDAAPPVDWRHQLWRTDDWSRLPDIVARVPAGNRGRGIPTDDGSAVVQFVWAGSMVVSRTDGQRTVALPTFSLHAAVFNDRLAVLLDMRMPPGGRVPSDARLRPLVVSFATGAVSPLPTLPPGQWRMTFAEDRSHVLLVEAGRGDVLRLDPADGSLRATARGLHRRFRGWATPWPTAVLMSLAVWLLAWACVQWRRPTPDGVAVGAAVWWLGLRWTVEPLAETGVWWWNLLGDLPTAAVTWAPYAWLGGAQLVLVLLLGAVWCRRRSRRVLAVLPALAVLLGQMAVEADRHVPWRHLTARDLWLWFVY